MSEPMTRDALVARLAKWVKEMRDFDKNDPDAGVLDQAAQMLREDGEALTQAERKGCEAAQEAHIVASVSK